MYTYSSNHLWIYLCLTILSIFTVSKIIYIFLSQILWVFFENRLQYDISEVSTFDMKTADHRVTWFWRHDLRTDGKWGRVEWQQTEDPCLVISQCGEERLQPIKEAEHTPCPHAIKVKYIFSDTLPCLQDQDTRYILAVNPDLFFMKTVQAERFFQFKYLYYGSTTIRNNFALTKGFFNLKSS